MIELQNDFINTYVNALCGRYNNINKQEKKEKPSYAFLEEETVEPIYKDGELHQFWTNRRFWTLKDHLEYINWLDNQKKGGENE